MKHIQKDINQRAYDELCEEIIRLLNEEREKNQAYSQCQRRRKAEDATADALDLIKTALERKGFEMRVKLGGEV